MKESALHKYLMPAWRRSAGQKKNRTGEGECVGQKGENRGLMVKKGETGVDGQTGVETGEC